MGAAQSSPGELMAAGLCLVHVASAALGEPTCRQDGRIYAHRAQPVPVLKHPS